VDDIVGVGKVGFSGLNFNEWQYSVALDGPVQYYTAKKTSRVGLLPGTWRSPFCGSVLPRNAF